MHGKVVVTLSRGLTTNLGNYSSRRDDVSISVETDMASYERALAWVRAQVREQLKVSTEEDGT